MAEALRIRMADPMRKTFRGHWGSYAACHKERLWNYAEFFRLIRRGHIVALDFAEGGKSGRMGLQLMTDDDGGYLSVLYYEGDFRLTWTRELAAYLLHIARRWRAFEPGLGLIRCRIAGRPEWRAAIERAGWTFAGDFVAEPGG